MAGKPSIDAALLLALWRQRTPIVKIAKTLGCSATGVHSALNRLIPNERPVLPKKSLSDNDRAEVLRLSDAGQTHREIAKSLGLGRGTVQRALAEAGRKKREIISRTKDDEAIAGAVALAKTLDVPTTALVTILVRLRSEKRL